MDISIIGYLAGIAHAIGYLWYAKKVFKDTTEPNFASWFLWAVLTGFNFKTYFTISEDYIKSIVSLISAIGCIGIFIGALLYGKLSRLDKWDSIALVIGIIALGIWKYSGSAIYTNAILQTAIMVSFIPTIRGVRNHPEKEYIHPWAVWCVAYSLNILIVLILWKEQYTELLYPVNGLLLHGTVAYYIFRKPIHGREHAL